MDQNKLADVVRAAFTVGRAAAEGAGAVARARRTAREKGGGEAVIGMLLEAAEFLQPSVERGIRPAQSIPQHVEIVECKVIKGGRRRRGR